MLNPVIGFARLERSPRRPHLQHEWRQVCARHILILVQQAVANSISSLLPGFPNIVGYLDLCTTLDRLLEGPRHSSAAYARVAGRVALWGPMEMGLRRSLS